MKILTFCHKQGQGLGTLIAPQPSTDQVPPPRYKPIGTKPYMSARGGSRQLVTDHGSAPGLYGGKGTEGVISTVFQEDMCKYLCDVRSK